MAVYAIEGIAPHSYIQAGTVKDAVRNPSPYDYKWVMTANKCVRNGAGSSTAEVGQFIAAAGFKEQGVCYRRPAHP
jgi:hypothetical protein